LSSYFPYPTSVHDVLAGFDWIVKNILAKRALFRPGRAAHIGKVAVCGELIGGSLATTLALTECRLGEPGISAAAVNNTLSDWVSLEQQLPGSSIGGSQHDLDLEDVPRSASAELTSLRNRLFTKPDRYFDPFASPILFFRTPSAEVPPATDSLADDLDHLHLVQLEESQRERGISSSTTSTQSDTAASVVRKASRRYPNSALNLRLPSFRFSSGTIAPFERQSIELARVTRQSLIRQSRQGSSGSSFGRKVLSDEEEDEYESDDERQARKQQEVDAEEKAQLHRYAGSGLWDTSTQGRERLDEVGAWLKMKLA